MKTFAALPLVIIAYAALPMWLTAAEPVREAAPSTTREPVSIQKVEIGFDGRYKLGFWTPVRITLAATEAVAGRLEVTVPDSDGVPTTVTTDSNEPIAVPRGGSITRTVYVKPGQSDGALRIRFADENRVLAEQVLYPDASGGAATFPPGLPATVRLLVVVGGELDLAGALRIGYEDPAVATHVASLSRIHDLPDQAIGWDAVDDVVLLTSEPDLYLDEQFPEHRSALIKWLELGGRLHVFVGRSGERLLSTGEPLAPLVPGEFAGEVPLRQASAIEDLCDGRYPLRVPAGAFAIPVPHIEQVQGHHVVYGGNLPLIVRSIRGFGELVWVGLDIDLPPLADWNGRPELLRRLIGVRDEVESSVASDAGKLTSLGYTDLVGQLRAALDVYPGVRPLAFSWVISLTLGYLILLGPLDYFLVHRWGRRPVWTWLTLPLFVVLVAGGAYGLAQASKGDRLRLNRAELVDVDLQSGLVRSNLWAHLYSPRHDRFTLSLRPQLAFAKPIQAAELDSVFSWLGLPGRGLGGLDATADGYGIEDGYRYDRDRTVLAGLPLPIWSSKSLHGRASATAEFPIDADLIDDGDGYLVGELTFQGDIELTGARIYYGSRVYPLGSLAPGRTMNLQDTPPHLSAPDHLTQKSTLGQDAPPYDPSARNARRVLQVMSWYGLVGGARYAGLLNRYQSRLDFAHLLEAGRAVLVAECAARGSQVIIDGKAIQDPDGLGIVVYRVVIPVARAEN